MSNGGEELCDLAGHQVIRPTGLCAPRGEPRKEDVVCDADAHFNSPLDLDI